MRLIRGAGAEGLRAIKPVRGKYIRPFLNTSKDEIINYASKRKLKYRIDASNEDISIFRNRVRAELVPEMLTYNPRFKDSILKTIDTLKEDDACLDEISCEIFDDNVLTDDSFASIELVKLLKMRLAIQRRVVRKMIEYVKGDLRGIDFKHVELIIKGSVSLAAPNEAKKYATDLPGGLTAFREYDRLVVAGIERIRLDMIEPIDLKVHGTTEINEFNAAIKVSFVDVDGILFERNGRIAHLDADKIEGIIRVRSRKPGDIFHPFGFSGMKKLQDFFVDLKIERRKRDRIPIVFLGDKIIWVAGYRIDERYRITERTKRVLKLELEEK
ncbi:MAG: tRNA lysidine(34) synthetase TilS [Rubrobacteridae bacterium]|nr:tRNA lysidine(34) synthetase TilS [Rubrobacteridae bacterium]